MAILAWIDLGLISGFIASIIVTKTGEATVMDIVPGIVGAIAGGWLSGVIGRSGITDINLYAIAASFLGAMVVLVLYHARRRYPRWWSANSRRAT
jgi:uncharacterized membrane protein YeaQ/YmgE (transglycosylase-associated protein family)